MREQEIKFKSLLQEFKQLKTEIFGNNSFVVIEDTEREKRYNQLLGFFYPQFRYEGWINPLMVM